MRRVLNGKVFLFVCLMTWVMVVRLLTGCSVEKEHQDKVRDLEFTVVGEADVPEELAQIIAEKKAAPFKQIGRASCRERVCRYV